jgi:iron complex transport system ATP-binding protein
MPMLAAASLTVRAGARTILHDLSLRIEAGERVAFVGPNGAGKSTLLRALAGERQVLSGSVTLKGRSLGSYGPRGLAGHRAVLSQSVGVAFPFTVAEIVALGAGGRHGQNLDALVDAALADADLLDCRDRIITTLSGGEQQRAHFARVLVQLACGEARHGPGVLLLDEPTASLDLRHQIRLLDVVKRCAARGTVVIAVLHDLNLAAMLASRVIVLHAGRLVADGPPADAITDAMLADVFGVRAMLNRVPAAGVPFVLPHAVQAQYEHFAK